MSDASTLPAPRARYAVLDLRGVLKVYGSGPAEVHAPRQAAAPYARAIAGSSLRVSTSQPRQNWTKYFRYPTDRNGLRLMAPHDQQQQ